MCNVVQLCLAANNILLMRKQNLSSAYCDRSCVKNGRSLRFPKIFIEKQTLWSNDKTIIGRGRGRAIFWDLSVTSRSIICRSLLICLSEKPRIYFIFQLMSDLCSRDTSIQLQWRTISKHELSHLNRSTALVGIQHTP